MVGGTCVLSLPDRILPDRYERYLTSSPRHRRVHLAPTRPRRPVRSMVSAVGGIRLGRHTLQRIGGLESLVDER
ncbi:hypothetical protein Acsp03_02670 [Actinomadura sp. NBRC 104412]|uniref:hypothetical protein n=1 Tax=Actinomadura sp. NBRC 104412 TaxID=3032203 RepID=UPI0024A11653|nr:hypothetical protein [Actinomadura sp. NBRC 104412]GLZ02800.1 hypothetical protein Acsp03_02670 [Actinomadura sp. NBRC 104412]